MSYDPDYCGSLSYYWEFGDGETSTQQNPYHSYDDIGTYTVTLSVIDDFGLSDHYSSSVSVINEDPYASFYWVPGSPYVGETVDFYDTSNPGESCDFIDSWYWEFGDGSTSTDQNPSHSYSSPGDYTITLSVTDGYGATDHWSETITVYELP
jgi:PKD repeat protein